MTLLHDNRQSMSTANYKSSWWHLSINNSRIYNAVLTFKCAQKFLQGLKKPMRIHIEYAQSHDDDDFMNWIWIVCWWHIYLTGHLSPISHGQDDIELIQDSSLWVLTELNVSPCSLKVLESQEPYMSWEIMVLITQATSEGSGEPAHPRSLARAFAVCTHEVLK